MLKSSVDTNHAYERLVEVMIAQGYAGMMVNILSLRSTTAELEDEAAQVLTGMAAGSVAQTETLIHEGVLHAIIRVMNTTPRIPLFQHCLAALSNLSDTADHTQSILVHGGLSAALSRLSRMGDPVATLGVQGAAILYYEVTRCFSRLAFTAGAIKPPFCELMPVLAPVTNVLRWAMSFPDGADMAALYHVIQHCCGTIVGLCEAHGGRPMVYRMILDAGLVDDITRVLVAAVNDHKLEDLAVTSCLSILQCLTTMDDMDVAQMMGTAGGFFVPTVHYALAGSHHRCKTALEVMANISVCTKIPALPNLIRGNESLLDGISALYWTSTTDIRISIGHLVAVLLNGCDEPIQMSFLVLNKHYLDILCNLINLQTIIFYDLEEIMHVLSKALYLARPQAIVHRVFVDNGGYERVNNLCHAAALRGPSVASDAVAAVKGTEPPPATLAVLINQHAEIIMRHQAAIEAAIQHAEDAE